MDSCSVKHCMMAWGIIGKLTPSFRSQIGHDGDQICNIHHFAPGALNRTHLQNGDFDHSKLRPRTMSHYKWAPFPNQHLQGP